MNNQLTFDLVVAHARKQGCKATNGKSEDGLDYCMYRAAGGLKCFAGCLITDEQYHPSLEDQTAMSPEIRAILETNGHDPHFVQRLQTIHDRRPVNSWESAFEHLAQDFGLTYTPPEN